MTSISSSVGFQSWPSSGMGGEEMAMASDILVVGSVSIVGTGGFDSASNLGDARTLKSLSVWFDSARSLKCLVVSFYELGKVYCLVAFSINSLGLELIQWFYAS